MSKPFFEVFPTLKLNDDLWMLFESTKVTKVVTNSARDYVRIHLFSRHLIQKQHIYEVEDLLKDQLFARSRIRVEILEEYELSGQYTPENLMREYYDSFLLELNEKSVVERNMLQSGEYSFEDENILLLRMTDTIVAQGRREALTQYLTGVFEERFHRPIEVRVIFEEQKDSKLKYNDEKLKLEVDAIRRQRKALREEKEARRQEEKKEAATASGGTQKQKGKRSDYKGSYYSAKRQSDDPNLIYGRDFDDEPIELSQVVTEMGEITIHGKVISFDTREIRNEKTIVMYAVTDFTDTIMVKMFVKNEQLPDILAEIKPGAFLKIKGVTAIDKFDRELGIASVTGIRKISDFTQSRQDTAPEKRVELHCHTKMSDMDGVSEVKDLVKRAHDWGHKAIAITDHGVAQSFPDANHYIETLDKDDPFKIIYGVEGYLVDDLTDVAVNEKGQSLDGTYVVFDLETTGFSPVKDKIIEIGAVKVEDGKITDRFSTFVNPGIPVPFEITRLTSITDQMVMDAPGIEVVLPEFLAFI